MFPATKFVSLAWNAKVRVSDGLGRRHFADKVTFPCPRKPVPTLREQAKLPTALTLRWLELCSRFPISC